MSDRARNDDRSGMAGLAELALRAVNRPNAPVVALQPAVEPEAMALFADAVTARDPDGIATAVAELGRLGITAEAVVDHYIPELARRLGALWDDDRTSFAAVTIATSRLQALVRGLSSGALADAAAAAVSPLLLVAVPPGESHTLGATVLAARLRRRGVSVRMLFGAQPPEMERLLHQTRVDAVLFCASCTASLESVPPLVESVRNALSPAPPIIVGGPVMDHYDDVVVRTGADHATSDLDEALALCGLRITIQRAIVAGRGT